MFPLELSFAIFVSLIEIWVRLTHFSIANLLCIFDSMLRKWVNRWHFYFLNGFMLVLLRRMEIFTIAHNFWKRNIVKNCLIVVK